MNELSDTEDTHVGWDASIIVAFVVLLVLTPFASFHVVRLVSRGLDTDGIAYYSVSALIPQIGPFACGFFLGRLLIRINPWKVLSVLAVVVVVSSVIELISNWSSIAWSVDQMGTSGTVIVFRGTLVLQLLVVALGIWLGRRGARLST